MADFVVAPGTNSIVLGLPKDIEIITDFPALLSKLINQLSAVDQEQLAALRERDLACTPLVCRGIVIRAR